MKLIQTTIFDFLNEETPAEYKMTMQSLEEFLNDNYSYFEFKYNKDFDSYVSKRMIYGHTFFCRIYTYESMSRKKKKGISFIGAYQKLCKSYDELKIHLDWAMKCLQLEDKSYEKRK